MSDKKAEAPAEGEPPKKKKKLLMMIVAGVIALVIAAVGAMFVLGGKKKHGDEESDEDETPAKAAKAKKKKSDPKTPPTFVKLEPFVVKLQPSGESGQENYVQSTPEIELAEATVADQVKLYMPKIRHKILLIFAGKKASDLSTPEGIQTLANQIRVSINATLSGDDPKAGAEKKDEDPDGPVTAVFLPSLIVQ